MVSRKISIIALVIVLLIIPFSTVNAIENNVLDGFENAKSFEGNNIELSPNELLNLEIQEIINPKRPYVLDFISEDLVPTVKIDSKIEAKKQEFLLNKLSPIPNLLFNNYTYGFIMIDGRITKEKLQNIKNAGIEILNFHSAHTYTAKIPFDSIDVLNDIAFVRWVGYSTLKQKLDPHLFEFLEVNNDQIILNQNRSKDLVDVSVFLFEEDNATFITKENGGKNTFIYNNSGHFGKILEQYGSQNLDYDSELRSYRVLITPQILKEIINLDFVIFIEKNRKGTTFLDESTPSIGADYLRSSYNGAGVSVGIIDSGYESDHDDLPVATYGSGEWLGSDPYTDNTGHGTYVAGILLGRGTANAKYKGVATGVTNISVAKIVKSDSTYEEAHLRSAMDWMASPPITEIVSVSLGNHTDVAFNGSDQTSAKLDNKVYNDNEIYIVSAGNTGPASYTIGIPGVAKNAITVGAVYDFGSGTDNIYDSAEGSSSLGPTGDGRYKPDVVAPGCNIDSTKYTNNSGYGLPPGIPVCGTSYAVPHVSGLITTLLQHYSDFKNDNQRAARVKALLTATAIAHGGNPSNNGNTYGMGKVDAYLSHYNRNNTNGWYWGTIACNVTSTGCCGGNITIPSGASRLVVTLVWHEPASAPGSGVVVLNDVDLIIDKDANEVSCGSGEYFSNSAIDNKENVTVENPAAGLYALKFYPFSVQAPLDPQPVRAAYMVIRGDPTPTTTVTISANDTSVIVGEQFTVTATVSPSSYVASGVNTKINLPNGLDVLSMNTTRKDGTIMNYGWGFVERNLGDIYESDSRSITWVWNATASGGKRINVSIDSDNGGVDDDVITIGVSSPEETGGDVPLISIITPTDGGTYQTNSVNLDWTSNETLATCYFRLDDGFYNQSICQFNYSYSGFSFSVGAQESSPQDVTVKGNYFYVVGITDKFIYEYDSSGTYTGFSFYVGNQEGSPQGITWNGSRYYVLGSATDKVYEYDLTGSYTGFNFSVANQETDPTGVTRRGNKFLIIGDSTDRVYEYDSSGTYTGFNFSVASEEAGPEGIVWDGVSFYVVGLLTDTIYQYSASGNYTGFNISTAGQDTSVTGIGFNGSSIMISGNTNNNIFKYKLQNNVATNTTLNSLAGGKHNITIVGKNLDGGIGQSGYSYFNISLIDNIPPIINTAFNKTNPVINDIINFTGNITDETGLLSANITYNISGILTKINFTLSGTSTQVSNVTKVCNSACVINFTMYATDTSNNVKQNSTLVTILDTTPPSFTTYPNNQTTTNQSVNVNWATDESANYTLVIGVCPSFAGVNSFSNSTFAMSHTQTIDGLVNSTNYCVNVTASDASFNIASANFSFITASNVLVPDTTPPSYSNLKTSPASPATHQKNQQYQFNATWQDNVAVSAALIEFNGVNYSMSQNGNEYYRIFTDLAVGSYNYYFWANDTSGNSNKTDALTYTINKANSLVYTYLNNSRSNITITAGTSIYLNGTLMSGEGSIQLYKNGTLINSGQSPLSNLTTFNNVGLFNITTVYTETQNYTSSFEMWWVNVTQVLLSPTIEISLISPNANINVTQNKFFNFITEVCCNNANCGEINVSLDPEQEQVAYTPVSETYCKSGKCNTIIYSGTRFVYEDDKWKKIEEAKSLKGVWSVIKNEDPNFPVEVIDYNYTSITLELSVSDEKLNKEINLKIYDRYNNSRKPFDINGKEIDKNKKLRITNKGEKIREVIDLSNTAESTLGQEIKWGDASTTIILQEANTENLGDTFVTFVYPNNNYGSTTYFDATSHPDSKSRIYNMFNISALPSGVDILESMYGLYKYIDSTTGIQYVHKVTNTSWNESNITWNNQPIFNQTPVNNHSGSGTGWILWDTLEIVSSQHSSGVASVSFLIKTNENQIATTDKYYSKESTNVSLRPFLNITYVQAPKGLVSTISGAVPFYTINSNPQNITLNQNQCQNVTWVVNATGNINTTHTFFAFANKTSDMSISNITNKINITILEELPSPPTQQNLTISSLQVIHSNDTDFNFEFVIRNSGTSNLTNINWSLNTGLTTISSQQPINLTSNENTTLFVDYTYPQTGEYTVTASATDGINQDSKSINVNIPDLEVLELSVLNSSNKRRVFEFLIKNYLSDSLSNVTWNIKFGDGNNLNNTDIVLQPLENMSVYVDYTYSTANTYVVNASAVNGTLKGYHNITITVT